MTLKSSTNQRPLLVFGLKCQAKEIASKALEKAVFGEFYMKI